MKPRRQQLLRYPRRNDGRTMIHCLRLLISIVIFFAIVATIHVIKANTEESILQANHFLADEDDSRTPYYKKSSQFYETDNKSQHLSTEHKSWLQIARNDKRVNLILSGEFTLIYITKDSGYLRQESYDGFTGVFCRLDWARYKEDPSSTPMFRLLVESTCNKNHLITYDLRKIVELAKAMDKNPSADFGTNVHVMPPSGFVFHESRCGSTLVANAFAAMEPDQHRVYSESGPPMQAIKACGSKGELCPPHQAAELLRDVVYLMGRTGDPDERRVFFKIQSLGTQYIDVVREAFPEVPWIFVYRDPIQVMASQLKRKAKRANCVRHLKLSFAKEQVQMLESIGRNVRDLSPVEKCALHLSNLCSAALKSISGSEGMGVGVNYENIVDKLITDVIPNHFKIPVKEEQRERIIEVSNHYSKGVRLHADEEWEEDSDKKEARASPEIKEASEIFLYPSYKLLED